MLTTLHHQYAPKLTDPRERRAYATHMCGLCHALGDRYGLLFRLITSHELIQLNLLTATQQLNEPAVIQRRCPLNPLLSATTNHDVASEFAAAVAIELANVKFADDVQDSGGRDVAARLERWLMRQPHQIALRALEDLEGDTTVLTQLSEWQMHAEQDEAQGDGGGSAGSRRGETAGDA
jgi:hypothetical protein